MLVLMAAAAMRSLRDFRIAASVVIGAVIVNAIFGAMNMLGVEPAPRIYATLASISDDSSESLEVKLDKASKRMVGFCNSAFAASYLFAPAVLMVFGNLLSATKRRISRVGLYFSWLAIVILTVAMILNAERSSFIALLTGLYVLFSGRHVQSWKPLIVLATVLGTLLLAYVGKDLLLQYHQEEGYSFFHRLETKREGQFKARASQQLAGLLTVIKHPLTGGTEDDYQQVAAKFPAIAEYEGYGSEALASHNAYINAGRYAGFLGWVIMGAVLVQVWRGLSSLRRLQNELPSEFGLFLGARAALISCMINACFHNAGIINGEEMSWALIALCCGGVAIASGKPTPVLKPVQTQLPGHQPRQIMVPNAHNLQGFGNRQTARRQHAALQKEPRPS